MLAAVRWGVLGVGFQYNLRELPLCVGVVRALEWSVCAGVAVGIGVEWSGVRELVLGIGVEWSGVRELVWGIGVEGCALE